MTDSLAEAWTGDGATLDARSGRPVSFGDPRAELDAALRTVGLADLSRHGRTVATGPDALALLQRLSTGELSRLQEGRGAQTVLTTPKGRILDRLFVHHLGARGLLLVGGPEQPDRVRAHVARFAFREQPGMVEDDPQARLFVLVGPKAPQVLSALGLADPGAYGSSDARLDRDEALVLGQDGFTSAGRSIRVSAQAAPSAWRRLSRTVREAGGRAVGDEAFEAWRILRGLPLGGRELTEEHNPLEAGLLEAVAFDKGCYVGQEVLARLRTYDKVSRGLLGVRLNPGDAVPDRGTPLLLEDHDVGQITSACLPPGHAAPVALGYVKRRLAAAGARVRVGSSDSSPIALLAELPLEP